MGFHQRLRCCSSGLELPHASCVDVRRPPILKFAHRSLSSYLSKNTDTNQQVVTHYLTTFSLDSLKFESLRGHSLVVEHPSPDQLCSRSL